MKTKKTMKWIGLLAFIFTLVTNLQYAILDYDLKESGIGYALIARTNSGEPPNCSCAGGTGASACGCSRSVLGIEDSCSVECRAGSYACCKKSGGELTCDCIDL